ncbi:non-homologous end-joining factor 1 [Rana temporaria]|uniref:non-homologous end-joining factor 1 n=1 Tax=Rana temporaria TaxID=8407 RepID=UPI001AACC430|nr:non-homologous end-joining factor 1 [Rana temporaria]XP_040214108.1 non-homologous end-joining factor 1 [Rana temporaria]
MAVSTDMDARLLPLPWKSLQIAECTYLCKVHFTDSAYCLLLSDLSRVWCEEAGAEVILERSKELNKRLKAPISSFLSHLSRLLLPLLGSAEDGHGRFSCQRTENTLMLLVKSQLSGLPFYWEFHCKEASVTTVCRHLVQPLVCMTKALDYQSQELCTLLLQKDAEIQEYQESGAVLTRGRLKTESFDEGSFQESFLAEKIPGLRSSWNSPGFTDRLQRLYSTVTAAEMEPKSEAEDVNEYPGSLPEPAQCAEEREHNMAAEDIPVPKESVKVENHQVPLADVLSLTQHSQSTVSKPKKKKAKGLFK